MQNLHQLPKRLEVSSLLFQPFTRCIRSTYFGVKWCIKFGTKTICNNLRELPSGIFKTGTHHLCSCLCLRLSVTCLKLPSRLVVDFTTKEKISRHTFTDELCTKSFIIFVFKIIEILDQGLPLTLKVCHFKYLGTFTIK